MPLFLVTLTRSVRVHSTAVAEIDAVSEARALALALEWAEAGDLEWEADLETDTKGPEVSAAIVSDPEG